jgi:hypothetical protein
MRPSLRPALPLACLAAFATTVGGDPAPQPQMSFAPGLKGTFNADWLGVDGRTYFAQFSLDLETWHYAPFIDFGDGEHRRGIECDADKYFLRLHYGDFSTYTTLDEAMNGHLDSDGLSNIFEVTYGYDPFGDESTTEGPDEEVDPDEDGLGNASEQAAGTNPMIKDNPLVQLEVTVE